MCVGLDRSALRDGFSWGTPRSSNCLLRIFFLGRIFVYLIASGFRDMSKFCGFWKSCDIFDLVGCSIQDVSEIILSFADHYWYKYISLSALYLLQFNTTFESRVCVTGFFLKHLLHWEDSNLQHHHENAPRTMATRRKHS